MRRNRKINKYGATTVFLAIILSALVIVQTVFLSLVIDRNRRMELSRALKCQAEAVLADYNRDLFKVYGIYAFGEDSVNDEVFSKVLAVNNIDGILPLECGGVEELDNYALRKAIISYYSYRTPGMIAKEGMEQLSGLIENFDKSGFLGKIKEYRSSDAAGLVSDILSGAVDIEGVLEGAGESIDLSPLKNLTDLIDDSKDDVTDFDSTLDLFDFSSLTDLVTSLESAANRTGEAYGAADHLLTAHYAAYNFDCVIDNDSDSSITGYRFSDIHDGDMCDSEFIMTGLEGKSGSHAVSAFIFAVLFIKEFVSIYTDASARAKYKAIAVILTVLIGIISAGTVIVKPDILEYVIIGIVSICSAAKGLKALKKGETIAFVEKDGVEFLKLGYRDFMFLLMLFTPGDVMLSRMLAVLNRDYGDLYTGVNLASNYGGADYDITKSYVMYE